MYLLIYLRLLVCLTAFVYLHLAVSFYLFLYYLFIYSYLSALYLYLYLPINLSLLVCLSIIIFNNLNQSNISLYRFLPISRHLFDLLLFYRLIYPFVHPLSYLRTYISIFISYQAINRQIHVTVYPFHLSIPAEGVLGSRWRGRVMGGRSEHTVTDETTGSSPSTAAGGVSCSLNGAAQADYTKGKLAWIFLSWNLVFYDALNSNDALPLSAPPVPPLVPLTLFQSLPTSLLPLFFRFLFTLFVHILLLWSVTVLSCSRFL